MIFDYFFERKRQKVYYIPAYFVINIRFKINIQIFMFQRTSINILYRFASVKN